MGIHDDNRKPRGRAKSLVQRAAVRRVVKCELAWPDDKALPRNFWRSLDKAVRLEASRLLGCDQGRFL
jgi:ribosomal protein S26